MACLRRLVLRRHRQRLLHRGLLRLVHCQFAALRVVADQDRRAVRRLHAQQPIQVRLIRRKDHIDLRVLQVQPRNVARIVVIGQQRIRPQIQKARKRRIVAQLRRRAQVRRHRLQPLRISLVIRHHKQRLRSTTHHRLAQPRGQVQRRRTNHRMRIVYGSLLVGMRRHIPLNPRARQPKRIQLMPRHQRLLANHREVLVHQVPPAPVDREQLGQHRALRRVVHHVPTQIALVPVQLIQQPACIRQLGNHLLLARRQPGLVVRHRNGLPARSPIGLIVYRTPARIARRPALGARRQRRPVGWGVWRPGRWLRQPRQPQRKHKQ